MLIRLIDERHHVLLVGQRRIGKTSLLREALRRLDDRGQDLTLFVDLQACERPEDLVVALSLATQRHASLWSRTIHVFESALGSAKGTIESVSVDQIELKFREATAEAWQARGQRLLNELAGAGKPVVICLDELPVMLSRLLRGKQRDVTPEGRQQADILLSWIRKVGSDYQDRLRFVVCGSIGLEPVVRLVQLSHTIAHLRPFSLAPWTREVADDCLAALAAHANLRLDPGIRASMLDRLGVYVPHHVQMYFGALSDECHRRGVDSPSEHDARSVYDQSMLGSRGHAELADYEERLLRVLPSAFVPLALDALTEAAVAGALTPDALDILAGHNIQDPTGHGAAKTTVLGVLEHDGYLVPEPQGQGSYRFLSLLLRDWWKRRFSTGYVRASERGARRGQ